MRTRVIPVLLVQDGGLVKTVRFKNPNYLGDPINAIRLYNDMEVDEIVVLDISASKNGAGPNLDLIRDIASECFMPLCYGGGVSKLSEIDDIFKLGVEKVSINTAALVDAEFLQTAAKRFGSQSIVASLDAKKTLMGKYQIFSHAGIVPKVELNELLIEMNKCAGEIFLNSVDQDGLMKGYDLKLIEKVSSLTQIPLVACGGAGSLEDMKAAISSGAHAAAAGSLFVYQSKQKGVLINYPSQDELNTIFL